MSAAEATRQRPASGRPHVPEELVFADSIRALQGPMKASGLSVVAVALVLCIALLGYRPWWELALWFAGAVLAHSAVAVRLLMRHDYKQADANRWARYYLLNGVVNGLYWGCSLLYFVDTRQPEVQFFIALALGGTAAGSIAVQAFYPRMMISYLLCLILPFAIATLATGELLHSYLGAGMLLLMVYLLYYGHFHARTLRRAIILRHENAALVDELRHKTAALELASEAKSQFFAAASHDLRQPLHALAYYTSLLDPQPSQAAHVTRIEQCIGSLDDLLEGVLDISKLDSGRVKPHVTTISLHELLQRMASLYEGAAAAKGLRLRLHAPPCWVVSDAALLERVVTNLLSNAVRYTERGTVLIAARGAGEAVRLLVLDTGIGIPPEAQEKIFDEFVQLNNPQRHPARGVGLGLATVRRLCKLLEHPLLLRSRPGHGSCFELRLPRAAPPEVRPLPTVIATEDGALRGHVLVVDDHELVRESLAQTLRGWGLRCDAVEGGEEAIALASRETYDAVLCDWRLPGGTDGTQVLAAVLARQPGLKLAALVTGETAASLGDVPAGILVLRKPIRPIRLRALLTAHLPPPEALPETPAAHPAAQAGTMGA